MVSERSPSIGHSMRGKRTAAMTIFRIVLQRPLWMLHDPERLDHDHEGPWYDGRLTFVAGPERLETGWWDDDSIARDYFVAINSRGVHLWVYRDRGKDKGRWFLHGMFG